MATENIYSIAFSHLSEADKEAMLAYQVRAEEIQHQGTMDSTVSIENILREVPGARRALKHYDREVGKLAKFRHS